MLRRTITWIDVSARERVTTLTSQTGASSSYDALVPLSNGAPTTWSEGTWHFPSFTAPVVGEYPSVEALMALSNEDAVHHRTHVFFPAPNVSFLLADHINADQTVFNWTQLEADLSSLSAPFSGLPLVTLLSATTIFTASLAFETYKNYTDGITWGRRVNQWRDSLGRMYLQMLTGPIASLTVAPTLADVTNDMLALSTAVVTDFWEGEMTTFPLYAPTTDLYNSVNDTARLQFADVNGNITEVILPAPARAVFLADGKTVDETQVNMALFITAALTELVVPSSGLPVVRFVGGMLNKRRTQGY